MQAYFLFLVLYVVVVLVVLYFLHSQCQVQFTVHQIIYNDAYQKVLSTYNPGESNGLIYFYFED